MKRKLIPLAGTALANPWPVIIVIAVVVPIAVILIVAAIAGHTQLVIPPGAHVTLPAAVTHPPATIAAMAAPIEPDIRMAAVESPTPPRILAIDRRPDGTIGLFVPAFTIVDACLDVNRWFTYQVVCEDTTIVFDPTTGPTHLYFRGRSFRPRTPSRPVVSSRCAVWAAIDNRGHFVTSVRIVENPTSSQRTRYLSNGNAVNLKKD